ncbi:MAG: single-stranded-DNA-specific exonuclease RecJ [Dehalococcoidia bacterium]|jgi:single-stranded-DNA-specific exonuclease|nr:single-stranded-DNA-specific exonuclease RecJ [Dehalococcoidia bacterium]MDW8009523.1 single-stranded-DNA-specific exonuclease RecJ [Chloroflexota bacterium]
MAAPAGGRWRLREQAPPSFLARTGYPSLVRQLLWHRGVRSEADARRFFGEAPAEHDPLLLPEMGAAVARLRRAVADGEAVAVFGDFDVDGVTAAALLTEALAGLGAHVLPYIPDRYAEGYGLNIEALRRLAAQGARVLLAADCGTTAVAEVEEALRLGMDVLVLDHHSLSPHLPPTAALVNPRRPDSRYPQSELASVGLAYKLAAALYEALGRPFPRHRFLELVALGTVTDLVPLLDENRWLVREGLKALSRSERPGLRALVQEAGLDGREVDTWAVGWVLGPRLNAAGRLAHARQAFDLLLCRDEGEARELARSLSSLNRERQRLTEAALARAREAVESGPGGHLIFVADPDTPAGIVGLVASRLAEEYHRPAFVCERGEALSRGSARSIPGFDVAAALQSCSGLLIKHGGHPQAAGFTAPTQNLEALARMLTERAAREMEGADLSPCLEIDAVLPLRALRGELLGWLDRFRPHGPGNPEPVFVATGVTVADVRLAGPEGQHLRLKLKDGSVTWPAFGPRLGGKAPEVGQRVDVVYSVVRERGDDVALELRLHDLRPSARAAP